MLLVLYVKGFRPQQGLSIMNFIIQAIQNGSFPGFPSPTGVKYYEFKNIELSDAFKQ